MQFSSLKRVSLLCSILIVGLISAEGKPPSERTGFNYEAPSFTELKLNETIARAKELVPRDRELLLKAVRIQLRKSMDSDQPREKAWSFALNSRVRFIDLNGDGVSEAIVQPVGIHAGCGATGNCPFWIFAKTSEGYKPILQTAGEFYRVEPSTNDQYRDIAVASRDSALDKTIFVFRFQKSEYRRAACYSATWTFNDNNGLHFLKHPQITRCSLQQ